MKYSPLLCSAAEGGDAGAAHKDSKYRAAVPSARLCKGLQFPQGKPRDEEVQAAPELGAQAHRG